MAEVDLGLLRKLIFKVAHGRNKKLQFQNCIIYWCSFVLKVGNRIHKHCKLN